MTEAVTVRRDGDTFQARMFWWRAARLLDRESPIIRVGFETGPKSFDDIWVEYDPARSPVDQNGNPLQREHIQCKWHVSPDSYGYSHLIDPEFINASSRSLLQRARTAQLNYAINGIGVRFKLLTNWRIDRNDPLREIIGNRSGALRVGRLFSSVTDNSKVGAIRKAWREHLAIDEAELRVFAHTLAFGEATDSLDDLRDRLDILFGFVGLRRVPPNESAFFYDDLIFQWMAQGRLDFDRKSFQQACDREGILSEGSRRPIVYGVKSFEHPIDRLQDRCVDVLDFVADFEERYIRCDADWADKLYPSLRTFLLGAAAKHERLRLALDAHATLAFAAGSILNIKSGRAVELEQRTTLRQVWAIDDSERDLSWPTLIVEAIELKPAEPDVAVIVGLTHNITNDAKSYIDHALPTVGQILICQPSIGPSARSVASGCHAFDLASALIRNIKTQRKPGTVPVVHLFIAAPNAFTFFLGQHQAALGRVCLYEFDFEGGRSGSYQLSLTIPVSGP
jgi:hypothetical protein